MSNPYGLVTQSVAEVVEAGGSALVTQAALETVLQDAVQPVRVTQTVLEVMAEVPNTPRVTQTVLEVVCNYVNSPSLESGWVWIVSGGFQA